MDASQARTIKRLNAPVRPTEAKVAKTVPGVAASIHPTLVPLPTRPRPQAGGPQK